MVGAKVEDRLRIRRGLKAVVSAGMMRANTRAGKVLLVGTVMCWQQSELSGAPAVHELQLRPGCRVPCRSDHRSGEQYPTELKARVLPCRRWRWQVTHGWQGCVVLTSQPCSW